MRKVLLFALILLSVRMSAEDFKILKINTGSVKIGKSTRVVGDVFSDTERIYWKAPKQAIQVLSLDSKKQYIFVSEDFRTHKMKSAKDYLLKNNRMSTRGLFSLSSIRDHMSDNIYWFNPTLVYIDYDPQNGEYFFLKTAESEIVLKVEGRQLVIDESVWNNCEPSPIMVDLYYHYSNSETELIASDILITPLPSELSLNN